MNIEIELIQLWSISLLGTGWNKSNGLQAIIHIILPKKILDLLLYKQISVMIAINISFLTAIQSFLKKAKCQIWL